MPRSRKVMMFEGQFSPAGTLALFDAPLMQPQPDWPAHTHMCGAPLYEGAMPDPSLLASLHEFLAAGDAPIVFALGSSAVWLGGDFWPAAIEAARRLGRRAILLTGTHQLPDLPGSVRVFNYLPCSYVFAHACAVVHQAGIGTLSQALRAGRPQLLTPVWFDQPDNAARACTLGVARTLPFGRVTAARLTQQLRRLLDSSSYAAAAQNIANTLNPTDGAPNAAGYMLEALGRA
jgi:rhamnosyltransferase subunit B